VGVDRLAHAAGGLHEAGGTAQLVERRIAPGEVERLVEHDPPRTMAHHDHPAAERNGLLHAVGDEHHGATGLLPDPSQLSLQVLPGEGIERAERLVHQHQVRIVGEDAGDLAALLHATGQFVDGAVGEFCQPDPLEFFVGAGAALRARHTAQTRPEFDVLAHRQPRHQRRGLLEHHSPIGAGPGHGPTIDLDRSGARRGETSDQLQQRRLAATARTDEAEKCPGGDVDVDVVEHRQRPAGGLVLVRHAANAQRVPAAVGADGGGHCC